MGTKRSVFINLTGELPSKAILFFANIFLARKLPVEDYGVWNVIWIGFAYLFLFVDWGMGKCGVREISLREQESQIVISEVFSVRYLSFLITLPFIFIYLFFFSKTIYFCPSLYIFPSLIFSIFFVDWFFRAKFKMEASALLNFASSLSFLVLLLILNGLGKLSLESISASKSLSYLIFLLIGFLILKWKFSQKIKNLITPKFGKTFELFREGWLITSGSLFTKIYYGSDIILLAILGTKDEVGIYSGIIILYNILLVIRALIVNALLPHLSQNLKNQDRFWKLIEKWTGLFFLGTLGIFLILIIFGKGILTKILGPQFGIYEGVVVLRILSITLLVLAANLLLPSIYVLEKKNHVLQRVTLLAALVNISLNFVFIPLWGMVGAAFTTLLAESIVFIGLLIFFSKTYFRWKFR